jgi:hypothetical protein
MAIWIIWHKLCKIVRAHQTRKTESVWLFTFSPITIPFFQYSCLRSSHVPKNLTCTEFDIQYFIPNLLTAYFLRSLCTTFILWKIEGHAAAGKEASCLEDFQIVPHFAFMSAERERGCIALFLPSVDGWVQIDGLDFKLSTWCYIIPVMIFWNVWKLISRTEDQSIGSIAVCTQIQL